MVSGKAEALGTAGARLAQAVRVGLAAGLLVFAAHRAAIAETAAACARPLYLTLDTGNMASAALIATILARHQVKATFFLANERTPEGNHALDARWRDFWQARVDEGHAFGNHTFDHVYFSSRPGRGSGAGGEGTGAGRPASFRAKPQFGASAGKSLEWNEAALCEELARVERRFHALTGARLAPWWRAPGGKAPAEVLQAARACGYRHVHWAAAGFLGDELPSERYPNEVLVRKALGQIREGDILMAHLGIWSRKEVFAPSLDPLIAGLKARGFCFRTLHEHPDYRADGGGMRNRQASAHAAASVGSKPWEARTMTSAP